MAMKKGQKVEGGYNHGNSFAAKPKRKKATVYYKVSVTEAQDRAYRAAAKKAKMPDSKWRKSVLDRAAGI